MELPHLGQQCSQGSCNKLDFLPIKCDACNNIYCDQHFTYLTHNCPKAYLKDNQVPECPLCNTPIPVPKGQQPDIVVGAHIDNNCQSDTAKSRRKVFTNKCSKKGCKAKEVIPVICNDCRTNYCLKHRHPSDHDCRKTYINPSKPVSKPVAAARVLQNNSTVNNVIGNMSEDEALARAIALSLEESNKPGRTLTQEELDQALARQLQMESVPVGGPAQTNSRCNLQ